MATALWCEFVSFRMYISGSKFEEHCSDTSRDISCSVFHHFSCTTDGVITVLICVIKKKTRSISLDLKRTTIFQKLKRHSSIF